MNYNLSSNNFTCRTPPAVVVTQVPQQSPSYIKRSMSKISICHFLFSQICYEIKLFIIRYENFHFFRFVGLYLEILKQNYNCCSSCHNKISTRKSVRRSIYHQYMAAMNPIFTDISGRSCKTERL